MKHSEPISIVSKIMIEFAELTGLSGSGKAPRRYLWTDAFAVCNFLNLYRQTTEQRFMDLAVSLVNHVHNRLGRYSEDDPRDGWISGLDEKEGKKHPTKGGLRIGKELNERKTTDPFDERLEWDRDGQYYHYLTKWMHALNQVSRVTGDVTYNRWAMELAKAAHAGFTYFPWEGGRKRMYWKMSIDLSYPLVPSMGHHDPLDGFITYSQLRATATQYSGTSTWPDLTVEIEDMSTICKGKSWVTDDPLGIGGLLCDAYRVAQLIIHWNFQQTDLMENLLDSSLQGLKSYTGGNHLNLPPNYRLAFRELGLSLGLRAVAKLQGLIEENHSLFNRKHPLHSQIQNLSRYLPFIELIEVFWLEPTHRESKSWMEHQDINMVMLATSLAPDGYLELLPWIYVGPFPAKIGD